MSTIYQDVWDSMSDSVRVDELKFIIDHMLDYINHDDLPQLMKIQLDVIGVRKYKLNNKINEGLPNE